MQPRELVARWREEARDADAGFILESCASELEAALAEAGDGWVKIEDIPEAWKDGRAVLLWSRGRRRVGSFYQDRWYDDAEGSVLEWPTHARLVTPPPCAREPADG